MPIKTLESQMLEASPFIYLGNPKSENLISDTNQTKNRTEVNVHTV